MQSRVPVYSSLNQPRFHLNSPLQPHHRPHQHPYQHHNSYVHHAFQQPRFDFSLSNLPPPPDYTPFTDTRTYQASQFQHFNPYEHFPLPPFSLRHPNPFQLPQMQFSQYEHSQSQQQQQQQHSLMTDKQISQISPNDKSWMSLNSQTGIIEKVK